MHRWSDRLLLKCEDGLAVDDVHDKDVVIMAGMGGRTMQEVLQNTSWRGTLVFSPIEMWRLLEHGCWTMVGTVMVRVSLWNESSIFGPVDGTEVIKTASAMDVEFGVQTHLRSRSSCRVVCQRTRSFAQTLPEQAIDRQKIPLYEEMAKRLSNL